MGTIEIIAIVIIIFSMVTRSAKYKGYKGEKIVTKKLKKLNKQDYRVINNLIIKRENGTSEIDHVVISIYGIFVIETKNYQGLIFGKENDQYWTQVIYKRHEKFRNPIKQNYGHIKAVQENLRKYKNIKYIPIIAFSDNSKLKLEVESSVVYFRKLNREIVKSKKQVLSHSELEEIYTYLISKNINSRKVKKEHVKNIKKNIKISEIKKEEKICPKCDEKLILRNGSNGKFYGCRNFPKCRYTKNYK